MTPTEQAAAAFVLALVIFALGGFLGASGALTWARRRIVVMVADVNEADTAAAHGLDQLARVLDADGDHPDTRRVVVRRLRDLAANIRSTRIRGAL